MHARNGFTLIELSIVLLIIGLITAAILVGKSLIRSAEMRGVVSEAAAYTQAVSTFKDKYKALPGDFANARNTWTAAVDDGDGNGWIDNNTGLNYTEGFYAWQELMLAGMVDGHYTGLTGPNSASHRIPGINVPTSKVVGGGWTLTSYTLADDGNGLAYLYGYEIGDQPANHILWLGGGSSTTSPLFMNPVMTDEEAFDLDRKIDDGVPDSGKVVAQDNPAAPECGNENNYMAVAANAGILTCSLAFKTGF